MRPLGRNVALLSAALLVVTAVFPVAGISEHALRVSYPLADGTRGSRTLDADMLVRSTSVTLLACAALTAWACTQLGRGRRSFGVPEIVVLVGVTVGGMAWGVPRHGPEFAALAVVAACVATWATSRTRRAAPHRAASSRAVSAAE